MIIDDPLVLQRGGPYLFFFSCPVPVSAHLFTIPHPPPFSPWIVACVIAPPLLFWGGGDKVSPPPSSISLSFWQAKQGARERNA